MWARVFWSPSSEPLGAIAQAGADGYQKFLYPDLLWLGPDGERFPDCTELKKRPKCGLCGLESQVPLLVWLKEPAPHPHTHPHHRARSADSV